MLDIGWSEILLIAVVAIVVIGPKDLPDALRTLGRMVTKVRRMAGEFQGQFNQAIREANLEDVKKDFDELRQSASVLRGSLNPVTTALTSAAAAVSLPPRSDAAPSTPAALTASAETPAPAAPAAEEAPAEPIPSAFATSSSFRRPS
jgi:sec-independent protein translocase protein TatB